MQRNIASAVISATKKGILTEQLQASLRRSGSNQTKTPFILSAVKLIYIKGDIALAISDLETAVKIDPQEEMYREFLEAIKYDPNAVQASMYFSRGAEYLKAGDWDQVIADTSKVIQLNPNDSSTLALSYGILGSAYIEKQEFEHAIADLEMAVKLSPDNAELREKLNKAIAFVNKGRSGIGSLLDPSPIPRVELKKRLMVIRTFVLVGMVIGIIRSHINGVATEHVINNGLFFAIIAFIYSVGIVPWLTIVKRDFGKIPDDFSEVFEKTGITEIMKGLFFAVILTVLWRPLKLLFLLLYISPFIGIFQLMKLLIESRRK